MDEAGRNKRLMKRSPASIRRALGRLRDPRIFALGVFGSVGRCLRSNATRLSACRDIDLLLITDTLISATELTATLFRDIGLDEIRKDVFVITLDDLERRLLMGDVQLISLLAEAAFIYATENILSWQARVIRAELHSDAREIHRLLLHAATVAKRERSLRESTGGVIAGAQAVLLSVNIQPLGVVFLEDILPKLARCRLAPTGYNAMRSALASPSQTSTVNFTKRYASWVARCTWFAAGNLARTNDRLINVTYDQPITVLLIDVGGTLFADANGVPQLLPGVPAALCLLAKQFRLLAVTNGDAGIVKLLKAAALLQYFEHVVYSTDLGCFKPEAAMFGTALQRINSRSVNAMMIGDSLQADVLGAWSSGIRALWICNAIGAKSGLAPWGGVAKDIPVAARLLLGKFND